MSRPQRVIALLSSGLDSSVALLLALKQGHSVAFALTYDYGQRAAARETESANRIAHHFGIPHRTLSIPFFRELKSTGALLEGNAKLPQPSMENLSEKAFSEKSAAAVWVPNRNGVFIEIAAAFAESEGADSVLVGFNREEAQTFPDNSEAYRAAITASLAFSTANQVKVISPTVEMTKTEIVKEAARHAFPFGLLWSCYESRAKMCGRCESCMRLKRALNENEVKLDASFEDPSLPRLQN